MGSMVGEEYSTDTKITVVGGELDISANTVIPAGAMVNAAYLAEKGE